MVEENKIVIVSDDNNIIEFDDVTVKHDTINRNDVADVEAEILKLENDKFTIDEKLVELKAKILYAKKVIELADAKKTEHEEDVPVDESANDEIPTTDVE